ncbi:MAG: SUMF1/EgtB/PvdO family nonheme iron enzyme, partial [Polyangiaceae bacterium]
IYGCYFPSGVGGTCSSASNIAPVGTASLGAGLWGQLDMAGDQWEWNLDWYAPFVDPCTDCAYLTYPPSFSYRVFRGGDFYNTATLLLSARQSTPGPASRNNNVGFRCARAP